MPGVLSIVSSNPTTRVYSEGDSISFTITTFDIANGATLYWVNLGSLGAADFDQNINKGTFTISNNTGTVNLTFSKDYIPDTPRGVDATYAPLPSASGNMESLIFQVRGNSFNGPVLGTSFTRYVFDTYQVKNTIPANLPSLPIRQIPEGQFPLYVTTITNALNLPYWEKTGNIGSIEVGQTSEYYIKSNSTQTFELVYEKISGNLPSGLTLEKDGTITGIPTTGTLSLTSFSFNSAFSKKVGSPISTATFNISTFASTTTNYTPLWTEPFFNLDQRAIINDLLLDQTIFSRNKLYRPFDLNFGVVKKLRWYIHYGVENFINTNLDFDIMKYFYKRRFRISEPRIAVAKDSQKNISYEVIYSDIIDYNTNESNESPPLEFQYPSGVYYFPSSINNLRKTFEVNGLKVAERFNPNFMKTIQAGQTQVLGYIPCIVYCYTNPGEAKKILNAILNKNIKFNQLDFTVDRFYKRNLYNFNTVDVLRSWYDNRAT